MSIKNLLRPHKDSPTDDLMQKIADGDSEAFASLYRMTQETVYAFLLSIVKNPSLAEDLMQDTYLSIRKSAVNYIPQGKPMAWIFTIARNLAYMEMRRAQRLPSEDYDEQENLVGVDEIEKTMDDMILKKALMVLDERERSVVLLHVVTGMKFVEISSMLSTPLGTILSCYHRAIRKLNKSVNEEAL